MNLNIGCGFDRREGFVNIDSSKLVGPDLVLNVDYEKLPYLKNTVDFVLMNHSFEHFANPTKVLEKIHRVCKPGAIVKIVVPFGYNLQDNLHHRTVGFHFASFNKYFPDNYRDYYHGKVCFKPLRIWADTSKAKKLLPFKRWLSNYITGIYSQITYELEVIK